MKFYIGPQVGLGEFESVDFSMSWLETPLFLSEYTVIGNNTIAVVYRGEDEIGKVMDFKVFQDGNFKFLVAIGNDVIYPELFYSSGKEGVRFAIVYSNASDMGDLMMFKYRNWAHAQESGMFIFGLVEVFGKVHHGVYAPLERTKDRTGIIHEGTSPAILEFEVV